MAIVNREAAEALIQTQLVNTIMQDTPKSSVFMQLARKLPNMTSKQTRIPVLFRLTAAPKEALEMKTAIITAVRRGIGQEVEPDGDIDLGLAKLAAKNKKIINAEYLRMAWISAGMDYGSAMRAEPGLIF